MSRPYYLSDLNPVQTFLGECKGVVLSKRDENDRHVLFTIVTEDDGQWFVSKQPTSSYWMPELTQQLVNAEKWLQANAEREPDGYGWRFKE